MRHKATTHTNKHTPARGCTALCGIPSVDHWRVLGFHSRVGHIGKKGEKARAKCYGAKLHASTADTSTKSMVCSVLCSFGGQTSKNAQPGTRCGACKLRDAAALKVQAERLSHLNPTQRSAVRLCRRGRCPTLSASYYPPPVLIRDMAHRSPLPGVAYRSPLPGLVRAPRALVSRARQGAAGHNSNSTAAASCPRTPLPRLRAAQPVPRPPPPRPQHTVPCSSKEFEPHTRAEQQLIGSQLRVALGRAKLTTIASATGTSGAQGAQNGAAAAW